ncbi:hypothetical protein EJP02_469 [Escherichia phage EJP2]|nr:hypothetical protein EJP02_469 [Escherichia phage EJP2]
MERVYLNVITGAKRKFIGKEGYFWMNNKQWVPNGTSEELIKALPYYKVL